MGGEADFGTDHHELVDECQLWILKIFGVFAWPAHQNLTDIEEIDFISVGIGPLPHDKDSIVEGLPKEGLSDDYRYMCKKMGLNMAPLPISTHNEYKLFNEHITIISQTNKTVTFNHYKDIATSFLKQSDGKNFPQKLYQC